MILKKYPIIRWLQGEENCHVVEMNNSHKELLSQFIGEDNFFEPIIIRDTFLKCMCRSFESFRGILAEIYDELITNEECGILNINGNIFSIDKNLETTLIYKCYKGVLYIWIAATFENKGSAIIAYTQCYKDNDLYKLFYEEELYQIFCSKYGNNSLEDFKQTIENMRQTVLLYHALKKYAQVETKVSFAHSGCKIGKESIQNYTDTDFVIMDSRWFTEICNNNEFNVRGHFRLQPYKKDGVWTKKLIYINEFKKHGYHRAALIDKQ